MDGIEWNGMEWNRKKIYQEQEGRNERGTEQEQGKNGMRKEQRYGIQLFMKISKSKFC